MLYNHDSARLALGCIFSKPNILVNEKTPFLSDDFAPSLFHKIMFKASVKLYNDGCNVIDEVSMDKFLENYPEMYEVAKDNNFMEFIEITKALSDVENIELYFNHLRKLTLLRSYKDQGWDIRDIFDEDRDEENKLDYYTIDDIINHFEGIQAEKRKKYGVSGKIEEMQAGVGFDKILEEFMQKPVYGASFVDPFMNSITRGWQQGHVILRSAPSGKGKTTASIADLCNISVTRYWDSEKGMFVDNPYKITEASFFIHTEMRTAHEVQPKFVSWIADIPLHAIMDGEYTPEILERLKEAGRILEESKIYLINDPKFTLVSLRNNIKDLVLNKGCNYGVFDYVQDNLIVGVDLKNRTGAMLQGRDMILLAIVDCLKGLAEEFDVGIMTMTQLNGQEKINEIIDEACLAGGKSQKNKIDYGEILLDPRKKDLEQVESIIDHRGLGEHLRPNRVKHVYKGRYSKYGDLLRIWIYFDGGTGRSKSLFCTDVNNNPIKVEKLYLENS